MDLLIIVLIVVIPILILISTFVWIKHKYKNFVNEAEQLSESIKNYNEKIVINLNEYRKPYKVVFKNGKKTITKGMFLEINKSNELFKKGEKSIGIITEIIDDREYDITMTNMTKAGNVYLIVEFESYKGRKYKVKTPAISKSLLNYIRVGQKVDVYYDESTWKMEPYVFQWQSGYHKENFDDLDFYVTNIIGNKVNKPSITKIIGYILLVMIALSFLLFNL